MPDINFEVISPSAIETTDRLLVRRGSGPYTGGLMDASRLAKLIGQGDAAQSAPTVGQSIALRFGAYFN